MSLYALYVHDLPAVPFSTAICMVDLLDCLLDAYSSPHLRSLEQVS